MSNLKPLNITGSFDPDTGKLINVKINDVDFEEKQPQLNLIECIKRSDAEGVKKCLKSGQNPNMTNSSGHKALYLAVTCICNKEIVGELVKAGADILINSPISGKNMLNLASYYNNIDLVKLFIDKKLDINQKDINDNTPLHSVLFDNINPNIEIVKILLDNGADYNLKNNEGKIVSRDAINTCKGEVAEFLKNYIKTKEKSVTIPVIVANSVTTPVDSVATGTSHDIKTTFTKNGVTFIFEGNYDKIKRIIDDFTK